MENERIELFLHGVGKPRVVEALENEILRAVLVREGAMPEGADGVFIGEAREALNDPDADADSQEHVDLDRTLGALRVRELRHVHTRAAHRVEVIVHFNNEHRKRRFSPAATIATATQWAKTRFKIDSATAGEWVLTLRPSGKQPRPEEHLGELLDKGQHELDFDLVREVTPQG